MNPFIFILVFIMFAYTIGFSLQLWKEKNKLGAFGVLILALTVGVAPFFTLHR
jgi:hypothetical protein